MHRHVTHCAAVLVVAAIVGGCGGGGGSSPVVRPDSDYLTLSTAVINDADGGVTSSYLLAGPAPGIELTHLPTGTVVGASVNSPPNSVSLTVTGFGSEPAFSFTILNPAALAALSSSPLVGCPNCLRATFSALASDGKPVSFIYLDPSSANLIYSTLGLWSKPSNTVPAGPDVGAAFSIGVVTRAQDLPTTGSATYNGFMVGRYVNGTDIYLVGANATAAATFSSGPNSTVVFGTTNTSLVREGGAGALDGLQPNLNLTGNLDTSLSPGANLLKGNLTATGLVGVMTGPATAKYYGPPTGHDAGLAEFGGAFFVGNGLEQMNGSFALHK